jgi:DNA-directed RNA polymerase specialized sigma24 family protein
MLEDLAEDLLIKEDLENKLDVQMLAHAPSSLLVKYQWLIQYLIAGYVRRGFLTLEEQADLAQEINQKMLDGLLARMQERYDARSLVRTYLGVMVRSLISDYIKHKRTQKANLVEGREELPEARIAEQNAGPTELLMAEEMKRLRLAFQMTPRIQAKTILCLRLLVRVPVTEKILRDFAPAADKQLVNSLVAKLKPYREWDDKDVWETILPLIHAQEGGDPINSDSLRRWVRRRLDWLITVMTGDPPRARYTDESLVLLLELYFDRNPD